MIPAFNISGVLPPFEGDNAAQPTGLSPYPTTMWDLATRFSYSAERIAIMQGLIEYRRALRDAGFVDFFQWLDGSFCEDCETTRGRPPGDIDVITFAKRPNGVADFAAFADIHTAIFDPSESKRLFKVDAYFIDMDISTELVVGQTVYWYGLFSHRRKTSLWKGMLRIENENQLSDDSAMLLL